MWRDKLKIVFLFGFAIKKLTPVVDSLNLHYSGFKFLDVGVMVCTFYGM